MPIVSTVLTKYAAPWPEPPLNSSENAKKKISGNR